MVLIIDIGNTAIKLAVLKQDDVLWHKRCQSENFLESLTEVHDLYPSVTDAALCQVGSFDDQLKLELNRRFKVFEISTQTKLPFTNHYRSKTLGNDRIALVAGALNRIDQSEPILIIDAGTCVTYDFINEFKEYHGGAISPGLRLRYESLHNYTANLPLLKTVKPSDIVGNTTEDAIHSGVLNGLQLEIKGFIKSYRKQNKNLNVFITGGDAEVLSTRLKNRFFATPFLMLHGIYNLYSYNKNL